MNTLKARIDDQINIYSQNKNFNMYPPFDGVNTNFTKKLHWKEEVEVLERKNWDYQHQLRKLGYLMNDIIEENSHLHNKLNMNQKEFEKILSELTTQYSKKTALDARISTSDEQIKILVDQLAHSSEEKKAQASLIKVIKDQLDKSREGESYIKEMLDREQDKFASLLEEKNFYYTKCEDLASEIKRLNLELASLKLKF